MIIHVSVLQNPSSIYICPINHNQAMCILIQLIQYSAIIINNQVILWNDINLDLGCENFCGMQPQSLVKIVCY